MIIIKDIVGYLGGIFIMLSFIPQVIKSYKTKSVEDISTSMIIVTFIGIIFYIIYGFLIPDIALPIIIMNSIFGITILFQLYLKIKYAKR